MTISANVQNTALLTALHLLVDGLCACSIFMLQGSLGGVATAVLFVTYNVLAFMTQPLVGAWMDRTGLKPLSLWAAVLLLFSGAVLTTLHPLCTGAATELPLLASAAILLGMGNSIFHVFGGKFVTESTANDPRHLGFFVASGALGLALGSLCSGRLLMATIAAVMMLVVFVFLQKNTRAASASATADGPQTKAESAGISVALLLFMLLIVFGRSFVGNIKPASVGTISHYAAIVSVIAFAGKASGGFIARRFGVWSTLTAALMASGAFLLLSGMHWAFAVLMVLCINCTMPLTLHLANRSLPRRAGLAFGMLAFMLIPGHALGLYCSPLPLTPHLLYPLVATIIIEALVLLALHERRWTVLASSVAMNVLTNVPLNVAVRFVPGFRASLPIHLALECGVVAIEALLFYLAVRNCRKAILYALLCNVTSYLCGVIFGLIC